MNSAPPGPNDDDHCYDVTLHFSAAKLDVYKHERLAYTEIPIKRSKCRKLFRRTRSALKALYHWLQSRF